MVGKQTNKNTNVKTVKPNFATYQAPAQTDIPVELTEHFENEGYAPKWVRIIDPKTGGIDVKNIAKKRRYGWEAITHAELKSLNFAGVHEMFEYGPDSKTKDFIVVGDLALFKRPQELRDEQNSYIEGESWRQINDLKRSFGEKITGNVKTTFGQKKVSFAESEAVVERITGEDDE